MQPGFIKGKLNQEGLDLVENQINKIGRNVIIQTPGLVCGFQSGKGGTGPCGGKQSQRCAAYNRNHRGNAVTEMDVVRINCTSYLQAREEEGNANVQLGLALCFKDEFKVEMIQKTSSDLLYYRSLQEFGLFNYRTANAERSNCYLNYITVEKS